MPKSTTPAATAAPAAAPAAPEVAATETPSSETPAEPMAVAEAAPLPGLPPASSEIAAAPPADLTAAPVTTAEAAPVATAEAAPVATAEAAPVATAEAVPAAEAAPEADAEVPTMVAVKVGDDDAQRFASGKAIIRRGDNLWTIARRVYGRGIKYTTIFEANSDQIRNPNRIYPGQVFDLPEKAE